MYKNILIVANSSNYAASPVDQVLKSINLKGATLYILFYNPNNSDIDIEMAEAPTGFTNEIYIPYSYESTQELDKEFAEQIDEFIAKVNQRGFTNVSSVITYTEPKHSVPKYANEHDIDLIVIGEKDEFLVKRDLESMTKHIIKHTTSNLLIVR
ncbi:universal stress protein [Enterococcus sp. HY326]|uniref:universal stress protein n=1 Tax=Enterococcus sp. HY326 TaxID=2971265 RepID=UPI00223FBB5C|nr:universal stress protein [Enterococcus sp. HY326]